MFDPRMEQAVHSCSPPDRQQTGNPADLAGCLAALGQMALADLRAEWRRFYRVEPPKKISRDLLGLAVAWKLQERVLGGHNASVRRQLGALAQEMTARGDLANARAIRPRPGARLIREWQGEMHEVLVLDRGFQWRSRHWHSLSAIAREITGTQWSGPRFFGRQKSEKESRPTRKRPGAVAEPRGAANA